MSRTRNAFPALVAATLIGSTAALAESHGEAGDQPMTILEFVEASPDHTHLAAALHLSGMAEVLAQPGPFTLFAPTDAALDSLPSAAIPMLLRPLELAQLMRCNIAEGIQAKQPLLDAVDAGGGSATVAFLRWCYASANREDDTLRLYDMYGESALVTLADQVMSNGIVHVTDQFMLPSEDDLAVIAAYEDERPVIAEMASDGEMSDERTIVENLRNNLDFSMFVQLLDATDWAERLQGDGPYTLFAPSNSAFEAFSDGTFDQLLKPASKARLTKIVGSHVLRRAIDLADLSESLKSQRRGFFHTNAITGDAVSITPSGSGPSKVFDESGRSFDVTAANLAQSNGFIHVIEGVLAPR